MALAVRALGADDATRRHRIPRAVLTMVERVMSQGEARSGPLAADLGPDDARALLHAWLDALGLDMDAAELLAQMQADGFSHADLFRRARRVHERRLAEAVRADAWRPPPRKATTRPRRFDLFGVVHPRRALRARGRLPGAREEQARRVATPSRAAWPWWRTDSAACTA